MKAHDLILHGTYSTKHVDNAHDGVPLVIFIEDAEPHWREGSTMWEYEQDSKGYGILARWWSITDNWSPIVVIQPNMVIESVPHPAGGVFETW